MQRIPLPIPIILLVVTISVLILTASCQSESNTKHEISQKPSSLQNPSDDFEDTLRIDQFATKKQLADHYLNQSTNYFPEQRLKVPIHLAPADEILQHLGEAEKLIRKAMEIAPEYDRPYVDMGRLYATVRTLREEDERLRAISAKAPHMYKKAIDMNPANSRAYYWLAEYHLYEPEAIEYYEKAIESDESYIEAYVQLGMAYHKIADYPKALATLETALTKAQKTGDDRQYIQAKYYIGKTLVKLKEFKKSENLLADLSIEVDEYNRENDDRWGCPHRDLGFLYSGLGQHEKSMEAFKKAAEAEIDINDTQFEAAREAFVIGDFDKALHYVDRAISLDPMPRYYALRGFVMLMKGKTSDARDMFDMAKQERSNELGAQVGFGHLCLIHRDYPCARHNLEPLLHWDETAFETATQDSGNDSRYHWLVNELAFLGMGWLSAYMGQHEQALKYFQRILKNHPESLPAMLGKGQALVSIGRLDEAKKLYAQANKQHPDDPRLLADEAMLKVRLGKMDDAKIKFTKAIERGGMNYSCPYEGMGLVYLKQGNIKKAKDSFNKAIEIKPESDYVKYNELARIFINEGRFIEAKKLLEKSIENYPHDNEAHKLLQQLGKVNAGES